MSIAENPGPTAPKRWVEKVGRSIKGSDTPHMAGATGVTGPTATAGVKSLSAARTMLVPQRQLARRRYGHAADQSDPFYCSRGVERLPQHSVTSEPP